MGDEGQLQTLSSQPEKVYFQPYKIIFITFRVNILFLKCLVIYLKDTTLNQKSHFICICVLPAGTSVYHVCPDAQGGQKRLQMVVNHHTGTGN